MSGFFGFGTSIVEPTFPPLGEFSLAARLSVDNVNAILNWDQCVNADTYQVYKDDVALGSPVSYYSTDYDAGALVTGTLTDFFIRAWNSANPTSTVDTLVQSLTRPAPVGPSLELPIYRTASLVPIVGPTPTFERNTKAIYTYTDGSWHYLDVNEPAFLNTKVVKNLYPSPNAPVTQIITLICGRYTLSCGGGAGSITVSGGGASGTAVEDTPILVDVDASNIDETNVTFTVAGSLIWAQLEVGLVANTFTATSTRTPSNGERSELRILGAETNAFNFSGSEGKGPNAWGGTLSSYSRTSSLQRAPDDSKAYKMVENSAATEHRANQTIPALTAGTYYLEWGASDEPGTRGIGISVVDATGGSNYFSINNETGSVSPLILGPTGAGSITTISTELIASFTENRRYRTAWTQNASGNIYIAAHLTATPTNSALNGFTYAGNSTGNAYFWGFFLKAGFPWVMPHPYRFGVTRPQEVVKATLGGSDFNTAGSSIQIRVNSSVLLHNTVRGICGGGNTTLRLTASNTVQLQVGAFTLEHPTPIAAGVEFCVGVRIKSGDFYLKVNSNTPVTATDSVTISSITDLYLGADASGLNPLWGGLSDFTLYPTGVTNTIIDEWCVAQGLDSTSSNKPIYDGSQSGHYLNITLSWTGSSASTPATDKALVEMQELYNTAPGSGAYISNFKGYWVVFPWRAIEPISRGVYPAANLQFVDDVMDEAAAQGRYVILDIHYKDFWTNGRMCPKYIYDEGNAASIVVGAKTMDEAKIGNTSVITDYIRMCKFLAARYQNRPEFIGMAVPESSMRYPAALGLDIAQEFAKIYANLKAWQTTLSAAAPKQVFILSLNWPQGYGSNNPVYGLAPNFKDIADSMVATRHGGMSWPDTMPVDVFRDPQYTHWSQYIIARTPSYNQKLLIIAGFQTTFLAGVTLQKHKDMLDELFNELKVSIVVWDRWVSDIGGSYFDTMVRPTVAYRPTLNNNNPFA